MEDGISIQGRASLFMAQAGDEHRMIQWFGAVRCRLGDRGVGGMMIIQRSARF